MHGRLSFFLPLSGALAGLLIGIGLWILGYPKPSELIWAAGTIPPLISLIVEIVTKLSKRDVGLDVIAALSMTTALVFGENLAANVVALMYSGGQYLEFYAQKRAGVEVQTLLGRIPRTVFRYEENKLKEVALDGVAVHDRLLVRPGDIVPVDGIVERGLAVVDQSALTGEAIPQQLKPSEKIMSGVTNAGNSFDIVATRIARESTYYGIVRLVEAAQRSKAPLTRVADKFAIGFLVLTVLLAGAVWFMFEDPSRVVAVLVVATPCPLILAVPIALLSGVSAAAAKGILIKGGAPLEVLSRTTTIVLDKTGTITTGKARVIAIHPSENISEDELLRLAASVDQLSSHIIARVIVDEANSRKLKLELPEKSIESPGEGVEGQLNGQKILVGAGKYVSEKMNKPIPTSLLQPGSVAVSVARGDIYLGQIELADVLRKDAMQTLFRLKNAGIQRIVLATGDRSEVAEAISAKLPFDEIRADLSPEDKTRLVAKEKERGVVTMVGDGLNDAPALAAADVGVAMGVRGSAASIETADVVILADAIERLVPALTIARRSLRIALQSVYIGLGASLTGMLFAAFGYLPPVQGAVLQEAIDIAVILNALRALRS